MMTEEQRQVALQRLAQIEAELHEKYMAPLESMPFGPERDLAMAAARELMKRAYFEIVGRRVRRRHNLLRGVRKSGNRFIACAHFNDVRTHLGTFDTEEEAHKAYLLFRRQHPTQHRAAGGRMMPELLSD